VLLPVLRERKPDGKHPPNAALPAAC